jgi:fibro-slime domain-containing protein/LPXTG-motif cell wall-anchored protein
LNRTGKNTTGWARRLTALLVTACLVMAMALPVYAEVDLLPDAPDEVELLEDKQGTASGEDTVPPEQNAATPVPDAATPEPEQSAEPEQPAPTETLEPTAEPTPTPEPAATATATPVPTVTPTATPEPTEQPQKMYAAKSVDSVQAVSASADTYTLYFAVPDGWENYKKVKIYAVDGKSQNDHKYFLEMREVSETKDHRKIYSVVLKHNDHYCHGGLNGLEFRGYKEEKDDDRKPTQTIEISKVDVENNNYQWWRTFDSTDKNYIGGNYYDGKNGKWTDFVAYDPNNHLSFAGNKMVFENLSGSDLANVTAVFYEKDGDTLKEVQTVTIRNVAASKKQKFKIPNVECSYVQFFANDKKTKLSVVYNFYDQETENAFQYDASDKYCYTYTAENTGSWGTPHGGSEVVSEVVYFDSTLSSYAYAGDYDSKKNSMPTTQDGDSGKMYCYFENDQGNYSDIIDMTKISPEAGSSRELWSATIPKGYTYTKVRFSGRKVTPSETGEKIAQKYDLTDMQEIPTDLNEPCFFADDGDDKTYWGTDVNRDGYWGEKNDVRDAEAGKDSTVVDITSNYSRGSSKGIKYITSTLYDYYTDYELNGNNRDNYATDPDFSTYRIQVPFRQFDQAVSDYYKSYKNASSILYPIYTGHFQCADNHHFSGVAEGLSLFGWSKREKDESKYKSFMAANNSEIDEGSGSGKYEFAFLGIVGNKLDSNGNLLMRESNGTDGTGLVEPHFNEAFLNGENSKNTKLGQVYKNVEFPFTQKQIFKDEPGVNYWWYDAAKTSLYLRKDKTTGAYYLGNGNGDGSTVGTLSDNSKNKDSQNKNTQNGHGFFPFNETASEDVRRYNYGYGAKLKIPFTLTEDGTVLDDDNNEQSIKFYFSGDDDVWVFIDGQLVLDIGGAHGKAAGIIDFDQRGAKKDKVTAYVSKVKYNNVTKQEYGDNTKDKKEFVYTGNDLQGERYNPTQYCYSNTVNIPNLSTGKHTLTMYYMERGMWESNMAVAFNFPDNNELQVQKIVDTTDVNDWFKSCFDTPDLFAFNIQNQATHYQNPKHDATIGSDVKPIELNTSDYASCKPATENSTGNIFKLTTELGDAEALHWYAKYQDTNPPSRCRSERYGILTLNHAIDISQMRYLTFDIYAKSESGQGELSLGNLYLELLDNNGKQKGCLDKTCLNGTTYGTVTLANDKWITIKLDLDKLNAKKGFDPKQVTTIRVGDNYPRHIYFKDFVFSAQAKATTKTGFTTKQEDIPVYGSIDARGLKNAAGAQFTTTKNNDTQVVDENGQFMLQNGETVTFSDQFRRGSYISLKETLSPNLYDTTWTVFENDEAVQSYGSGNTVKGDTKKLNGQAATESQPGPDDGRTEVYNPTPDIANDGYTKDKKPDANTIVFRSYKDPDENASSLTKLKVQFVNKVKTGKLVIKKAAASGEDSYIKGEYTFNVTFTNVGDEGLEQETIKKQVTIDMNSSSQYEISGIPIGTRFRIEEVKTSDGSHLQGVSVTGGDDTQVVYNTYVQGSISGTDVTATFTNTMHELINIDFTKTWENANGSPLEDGLPGEIYIQLQRRKTKNDPWKPVRYPEDAKTEYVTVTPARNGWNCAFTFANLDKFDVEDHTNYEYRIVEGTLENGNFTKVEPKETIPIKGNTYVVTAKAEAKISDEDGTKKTNATVGADGTITGGSGTIVLTNTLQNPKFVLDIIKKDANNEKTLLDGVEFKLEKLVKNEGKTQWEVDTSYEFDKTHTGSITAITGGDGKITDKFKDLKPGRYRLTETKAHPGYNLLSKPIDITFEDGKCYINDSKTPETKDTFTPGPNNTYTMNLTVLNRKTPELPHTGADAPSLWLLIGMPLAVAGLLIFTFRYNRKGGRRH